MPTTTPHVLTDNFARFFKRLNPSQTYTEQAAQHFGAVKRLLEDRNSSCAVLSPTCFLQGSYKQATAIYSINDVDLVVLCRLWQPASLFSSGKRYGRDEVFDIIAAPLKAHHHYKGKVRYSPSSMCIKVDLGIKLEILPVMFAQGTTDASHEPFRLYRPRTKSWENGYARTHQRLLSEKNANCDGNFIPMIKVLKHLRTLNNLEAVSFHLEALLFHVSNHAYRGSPSTYIPRVLAEIGERLDFGWHFTTLRTPCGERDLFTSHEWSYEKWSLFLQHCRSWALEASTASRQLNRDEAISRWQALLGKGFFPA